MRVKSCPRPWVEGNGSLISFRQRFLHKTRTSSSRNARHARRTVRRPSSAHNADILWMEIYESIPLTPSQPALDAIFNNKIRANIADATVRTVFRYYSRSLREEIGRSDSRKNRDRAPRSGHHAPFLLTNGSGLYLFFSVSPLPRSFRLWKPASIPL